MEEILGNIKDYLYIYTITMVRMTAAFASFPLMNKQILGGAMVRNGIVGAMAIFLFPLVSQQVPETSPGIGIIFVILLKEAMIGMFLGFLATIPLWAMEAAGFFIDNQRGASMASSLNPMSGSESSPMGILFSQAFAAVYLISGVFLILIKGIFFSYQAWPVFSFFPELNMAATAFFLSQFDLIITLAVWLAAPIIICMFITEFGIALISRSAPQLNVFILAMPIKSAIAVAILTLYVGILMTLGKKHAMSMPAIFQQLGGFLS